MALVDPRGRGIDDDEHLGRKVLAPAIEDDARHVDVTALARPLAQIEMQRRQPVLAVDDEILRLRLLQATDAVLAVQRLERELFVREQQHRAGYRRLAHRHLVEVLERPDLRAGQLPLESSVVVLDTGDELGDLVALRYDLRRDLLTLPVIAADEPHLAQDVLRGATRKIEDAVFLSDARGKHGLVVPELFVLSLQYPRPGRPGPGSKGYFSLLTELTRGSRPSASGGLPAA